MTEFGKLLDIAWTEKKKLSDWVSNPHIDEIYEVATKAGAVGGKILGAGGGGFLLLFVEPELRTRVAEALKYFIQVPFHFEVDGSKIVVYQPSEH